MKTLYIVRHAKSSWKNEHLTDFERPLNKRGHGDAPMMGKVLRARGVNVQLMRSSPANRALSTARLIAKEISYPEEAIESDERMYGAGERQLYDIARMLPDEIDRAMIVGHNPGMMMLAELLGGFNEDNLPTCGVVCIELRIASWREASPENGNIRFYEYPKKHKDN